MTRRYPGRVIVLTIVFCVCLLCLAVQYKYSDGAKFYSYRLVPFSWPARIESWDYRDTAAEKQCFNGDLQTSGSDNNTLQKIPNVVHFIWGLKDPDIDSNARKFSFANYLAIRAALVSLNPDQVKLHYSYLDQTSEWFQKAQHNLTLVYHDPHAMSKDIPSTWHTAHMSDVLRLQILRDEGGIYMDMDVYAFQPFDTLLRGAKSAFMGHEGGNRFGLCNGVIVAAKDAPFLSRWLKTYDDFVEGSEWNYHSVVLPKQLEQKYPDEICALSPAAFFWPTWSQGDVDFMHEPLSTAEAVDVQAVVDGNKGALYQNQLAYHAWNQVAFRPYLLHLTPEKIMAHDTRFNILMRRFLE